MVTESQLATIRVKKLGVMIRDARLVSGKSIQECARALGVPPERYSAYELGEEAPSLPEMELLGFYLDIPLEHFWGRVTLSKSSKPGNKFEPQQLVMLRQRMIGVMIRQARLQKDLSTEELAEQANISSAALEEYELGATSIPVPTLEALANVLNRPLREFQDHHGPVGVWANRQRSVRDFLELPLEMQSFVSKPINRPYLELAQRLSEMSVDKLRSVAEGLLEITL